MDMMKSSEKLGVQNIKLSFHNRFKLGFGKGKKKKCVSWWGKWDIHEEEKLLIRKKKSNWYQTCHQNVYSENTNKYPNGDKN